MSGDPTSLAYGLIGLSAGVAAILWRRKSEIEERCEFLDDMSRDLEAAFDSVDAVLADKNTPKPIREVILFMLSAHADRERGERFAEFFLNGAANREPVRDEATDPVSQSMTAVARHNPALARQIHLLLATLAFGLVFLHKHSSIKVERIKDQAVKDPASLWSRISRLFSGNNGTHHPGGTLLPA